MLACLYGCAILPLQAPVDGKTAAGAAFSSQLEQAGGTALGAFVTDAGPNDFPPLPLGEGEPALVFLAGFSDRETAHARASAMPPPPPPGGVAPCGHPAVPRLARA